mmetsp:Transcript_82482/g.228829  ORF Transcript_82482/g.228829 Transcript_82482/m.228829 type:complete len:280 (-) Transcript_82482:362-1201(-)
MCQKLPGAAVRVGNVEPHVALPEGGEHLGKDLYGRGVHEGDGGGAEHDRPQRRSFARSVQLKLCYVILEALTVGVEERAIEPDDQHTWRLLRVRILLDVDPPRGDGQVRCADNLTLAKNVHLGVDNLLEGKDQRDEHGPKDALKGSKDDRPQEGHSPDHEVLPLLDSGVGPELPRVSEFKQPVGSVDNDGVQDAPGHEAEHRPEDLQHARHGTGHEDVGAQGRLHPHVVGQGAAAQAYLRGHPAAEGAADVGEAKRQQLVEGHHLVAVLHPALLGAREG